MVVIVIYVKAGTGKIAVSDVSEADWNEPPRWYEEVGRRNTLFSLLFSSVPCGPIHML